MILYLFESLPRICRAIAAVIRVVSTGICEMLVLTLDQQL